MRRTIMVLLVAACSPPQYNFVAPELPIASPLAAALPDGHAVAVDGLTKHHWASFSADETCFQSRLSDLRPDDIDERRPFILMGFRDPAEPLADVPSIASSRVTVKSSGQEDISTEERRIALVHVDVEVCFKQPGRIITDATRLVVLRVPYSTQGENIGSAGSRDGVWRLTK